MQNMQSKFDYEEHGGAPLLGVNVKDFMFAYSYNYQANDIVYNSGGFHQITLGFNFNCGRAAYSCNCPAVKKKALRCLKAFF